MFNYWDYIGNKCLKMAKEMLDEETAPGLETAETVKCLVETAVMIDNLNLRWAEQSRSYEAVFPVRTSGRTEAGKGC